MNLSGKTYDKILISIVKILMTISDNSSYLSKIVDLLTEKLGVKVPEDKKESIMNSTSSSNPKQQIVNLIKESAMENDSNDNQYLLNLLDALAKQ